jgi:hypothetical protein
LTSVLEFVVDLAVTIVLTAWVVRRDMRKLPPERYARSWNVASFWSAVVGFGPLSVPVHFIRTRRSLGGAFLGLLWGTLVVLGSTAAVSAVTALASLVK